MGRQVELYDTFQIKMDVGRSNRDLIISDSKKEVKKGYSLICEVNATHSGTLINNRIYPPESMQKGIRSWTAPYKKPVLVNHDDTKDPIGRVLSAKYIKTEKGMLRDEYKPILRESDGYGFQRLTIKITDEEAINKILDGRYETVSVRMTTDHCYCSICNADWSGEDGPCEHTPGTKYDNKLAYMTTGDLSYREVSFVNIPADEYAGVKEAIMSENKDSVGVKLYANNDSEKVLSDLSSGANLYTLLDAEAEASDDVVTHLLDKSNKAKKIYKEEDVKLNEVTKEQLLELASVKELISNAKDEAKKECEDAKKQCEESVAKIQNELEALKLEDANRKKEAEDKAKEEEEKKKKEEDAKIIEEDAKKKKETEEEEEEEEEEDAKKKESEEEEEDPKSKKKKAKKGGMKKDSEDQSQEGKDLEDSSESADIEETNKKLLDENVKINSELHKMYAEKLYDLKKSLRKPDVVGISTPDARSKKIEEYAQRSVSSLKDQIRDLQLEQDNALTTGLSGQDVTSPAISQSDLTNEVMEDKKKTREGKQETLTRLFPKSK